MTILALALSSDRPGEAADGRLLTDFGANAAVTWITVNDGVMGGRSRGGFRIDEGRLLFTGSTNTNGGGFSSIRSRPVQLDLSAYNGVRLRVKADGRRYTFRLTTSSTKRGRWQPSYWADFETKKDAGWQTVDVPFDRFRPRWRGRMLNNMPLDTSKIDGLGIMIYDKRDGPFRFEADWIRAYGKKRAFNLASYQWKKRPFLVFAPSDGDVRAATQLTAIRKTQRAFDERDMVLVVVRNQGVSKIGDQVLTAAQAKSLRTTYGVKPGAFGVRLVGKDGSVKRMSAEVLDMMSVYALIDDMPMRKREMASRTQKP